MWIAFGIFVVLWYLSIDFYFPVVVSFAFLTSALLVLAATFLPVHRDL